MTLGESRKLRVLVITALYPPHHLGGYELRCNDVVGRLRARGHQIHVITSMYGVGRRSIEGEVARVLHLEPSRDLLQRVLWDTQDLRVIHKTIRRYRPDVVYLWHMAELARTIFPFLARLSLPVVYDEGGIGLVLASSSHGRWLSFCEGQSRSRAKAAAKRMLCLLVSALTGGMLPRQWAWPAQMLPYFNSRCGLNRARAAGVPVDKACVIYSGVDLGLYTYRPRHSMGSVPSLVVPGRVAEIKGIHDAIAALSEILALAPGRQINLRVIGPLVDPAYYDSLVELVRHLGLERRVSFEGAVAADMMPTVYEDADICLFPSHQVEGLSRVPLEAMAAGVVVVGAGNEGSAEIIRNGETGFIVPDGSPSAVAAVVKQLIEDPSLYRKLVESARQEVEQKYTLERAVDQIEQVVFGAVRR